MLKVAIVGTAPTSVNLAPYDDITWDIWSLGANAGRIKRLSRWFELHTVDVLDQAQCIDEKREAYLNQIGKDLYIGHESTVFPNATIYPKDEIVAEFGNYFTSSIAWMIALAIHDGAEEIGLWGVEMIGDGEYSHQRACCEYLLGVARGKGIKIHIPALCPLLRAERLYAFEHTELAAELQGRIKTATQEMASLDHQYMQIVEKRGYAKGTLYVLAELERRYG